MYYREDTQEDVWYIGNEIRFPDGTVIKDGVPDSFDGWDWSVEPPEEYIKWLEKQRLEELRLAREDET